MSGQLLLARAHYRRLAPAAGASGEGRWLAGRRRAGPGDWPPPSEALAWAHADCDDLALQEPAPAGREQPSRR
jgi:hypothetical protein